MSHTHLFNAFRSSLVASFIIVALLLASFLTLEPKVGRGATDTFTITQQITEEISFLVNTADVTMVGSILGLTGGYATGTTVAVVRSNNPTGYNMTMGFAETIAMKASSTAYINNYTPAGGGVPDYNWIDNSSGGAAEFGYTVIASTTAETDQSFLNNGSACDQPAGSATDNKCWLNPTASTSPETIINSNAPSVSSTTTIKFKVAVPSNPTPALPEAFYVATATLTATNN